MSTGRTKIRKSGSDKVFDGIVLVFLTLLLILVLYPLIYIVSASFSSASAVTSGKVILLPVDFSLEGYKAVFENKDIWLGYKNTIIYTVCGTFINVAVTLMAAYPLSRKDLKGKGILTFFFTFTMLFGGGMIPNYSLIRDLHLMNTRWAIILPGALSVYNMIVARTFIQSNIPDELLEASQLDGCSDTKYFFSIILPLSKAVIAVLALFYGVGHWNAYFNAFLYLNDKKLYPLQIFLREILINNTMDMNSFVDPTLMEAKQGLADLLKYSLIIVASVPVLCLYPFAQKYFVKGVMIGSVKG